ncbi:ABC transporter G family member 3-like [Venturia canescens]|uniref:ABC transporter G family member 3-like n=1 Tax=Venturia canescens TaxID=32260 RepID=UPI001C9CD616|nr:ABC transporter G family member 3-like [Venturia canescens]
MTTGTSPNHFSPSRTSLSCCQGEQDGSNNGVNDLVPSGNNNYLMKEKHMFPKRPEVDLTFRNIRYNVKLWNFRKLVPETKEILHGVSGEFRAGELTAIMGPSGAGKSTLLNVMAGLTVQGASGEIMVNGKLRSPYSERWKRTSSYIQQDSLSRPQLTVGEVMSLAAHLKLGYTISAAYKHTQVLELLEMLGLSRCYDTLCSRLSGGQKKRLDVALELLSNPSVLFLDEPTTGLDSASCSQCIALLQRLARVERRTIVCTIHQPSALLFEMFDSLYAVAGGHCIYRGPIHGVLPHLSSVGVSCPPYHNPADFLIEVAIGEYGVTVEKLAIAAEQVWETTKPLEPVSKPRVQISQSGKEPPPPAGFLAQCYLLYKRQLMCLKRDHTLMVVRLLCHLLIGVIFGYLYMGSGYRANGVLANYAYVYGSLLLIVYTGKMAVTLAFPLEMQILKREHFNRWYRLAPYYISMLLVEIPFQAACAATYLGVSYWLTGQPVETDRILPFMIVSIAASLTAQAWGFFIGATTPIKIAVFAGPIIAVLFSVFGFCIRYMDTPAAFRWMFHVSYFRAGFHSLLYTVYGSGRKDLKCDDFYCHYKKPAQFLKEMEINDTSVVNNLVLIVGIGVLLHLLTASALWCKLNRKIGKMSATLPDVKPAPPSTLKLDVDIARMDQPDAAGDATTSLRTTGKSLNLEFHGLSFSVRNGLLSKGRRLLLNDISGDFRSGELTAIMGPSGAGKSTLMDILAGFTTTSITGRVAINGRDRDLTAFRRSSAYIMQEDDLQALLTIDEAMRIAAELKLRSTHNEKMQRIDEILVAMGLSPNRDTRIGSLSGGQRKRVAIALELLNNPPIMFFDEPTSGLDSVSSKQCLSLLNILAREGRTIILSIHQPSATLFNMIDHLHVIAEGNCVYTGGTKALVPFLGKHGLNCPTYYNPADFLLEVCNGDYGDHVGKLVNSIENGKCNDWRSTSSVDWNTIEEIIASGLSLHSHLPARTPQSPITPLYCERQNKEKDPAYYATGFWKQLYVLSKRNVIKLSRDKVLTFMRLGMHLLVAVLVGVLYYQVGQDASYVFDNFNALFFNIMFLMYSAFSATLITFPSELPIVSREHFNRWYKLRSFYLANKIADFPVQVAAASIYTLIVFYLTGQLPEKRRLVLFVLIYVLISLVAQMLGVILGIAMKVQNGVIFGPLVILPFTLFSGFFVHLNDAPPYLQWLFHTSFLKYGFEGVMTTIYGFNRKKLACSEIYCHFAAPQKLMNELDMKNIDYWYSIYILVGLYIFLDLVAFAALRLKLKIIRR